MTFSFAVPLALALLTGSALNAHAAPVPLADFFDHEHVSAAELSPDARFVAIRIGGKDRDALEVMELATGKVTPAAKFKDIDIGLFGWVNEQRLVFSTTDKTRAQGEIERAPGLYAVDRDGEELRQLVMRFGHAGPVRTHRNKKNRILALNHFLVRQAGPSARRTPRAG
jgi:hypothetical protein